MQGDLLEQLEKSKYLKIPMEADNKYCAETRWLEKTVTKTRKLPLASDFNSLRLEGPGKLSVDDKISVSGEGSVKLDMPVTLPVKNPSHRTFATSKLIRPFYNEDITQYNRVSLWVLVEQPGIASLSMIIELYNEGEHIMPRPGRFEGQHMIDAQPGVWKRVVWEFPYCYRDNVTGISISAMVSGVPTPVAARTVIYFDDMRLETVDADNYKGFDLRKDAIAYCHSGYRHKSVKHAMVQNISGRFVIKNERGDTVFSGQSVPLKDGFELLDFTAFDDSGSFTLHIGGLSTNPFLIGDDAYYSIAWKTLNFFFTERCGFDVPGIHAQCHLDVMSVHPDGRMMSVAGGWHDAADLTQSTQNTAECAFAMLELAESVKKTDPVLHERALEEARWGLNWLMRTRWGDGFRHCGTVVGYWTNNYVGDFDDITQNAENRPFDNFLIAGVCAKAYTMFKDDKNFSAWCEHCAKEDFYFALEAMNISVNTGSNFTQIQLTSQAAVAAMELFLAFGDVLYLNQAVHFARIIMNCQQKEAPPGFKYPICGYFFENEKRARAQVYYHRTYEHAPVKALSMLLKAAPDHDDSKLWQKSLYLYAEYVKTTSRLVPYGILPNGIYELDNTDFSTIYREGSRRTGAPSIEEYNAQVKNGISLDSTHYLRIFPIAFMFRGFYGTLMGRAIAAFETYYATGDEELLHIAVRQMEWLLGFNPHASSGVYGEGYDYHPLYTAFEPQIVGAVPVGLVETFENEDIPFYPMQNMCTYKEIWVHTTCRLMWLVALLNKNK